MNSTQVAVSQRSLYIEIKRIEHVLSAAISNLEVGVEFLQSALDKESIERASRVHADGIKKLHAILSRLDEIGRELEANDTSAAVKSC